MVHTLSKFKIGMKETERLELLETCDLNEQLGYIHDLSKTDDLNDDHNDFNDDFNDLNMSDELAKDH